METTTAKAIELFRSGNNCAQSVLKAFAPLINFSEYDALRTASAFGGGMGRLQLTCGVLTGAYMAIGIRFGKTTPEDTESNDLTISLVKKLTKEFKQKHGCTGCRELLEADMNTEEGRRFIEINDLKFQRCERYVETACNVLSEILQTTPIEDKKRNG